MHAGPGVEKTWREQKKESQRRKPCSVPALHKHEHGQHTWMAVGHFRRRTPSLQKKPESTTATGDSKKRKSGLSITEIEIKINADGAKGRTIPAPTSFSHLICFSYFCIFLFFILISRVAFVHSDISTKKNRLPHHTSCAALLETLNSLTTARHKGCAPFDEKRHGYVSAAKKKERKKERRHRQQQSRHAGTDKGLSRDLSPSVRIPFL